MQRIKPTQSNLRRFALSPRNRVLSTPKFDLNKFTTQQEQRVRNYVYKKSNLLGKGYSSKVYKAHKAQELYKPFAIKVIDLSSLNYQQRKNLQFQLKIHKSLSHPNIVKCYQTFKTTSAYYLILQYCQHGTLSQYLKNHKKLDQSAVIHILSQVIQGFFYLTDLKILHRDLKPQNILRKDNTWKISDFGFCFKLQNQIYEDQLNVGTPLYMPLESLVKNLYSHKSDIYSIGIMVYKMLTGNTPWKCSTQKQLIQLMMSQKIILPQLKNKYLSEFLKRSLSQDIEKRLNLQDFKELFKKIKQEQLQIQKQSYLGNDLKKLQSSRSLTTADSYTTSKLQTMSPRQTSFNTSINSTSYKNLQMISERLQFVQNSLIIREQLQKCRLINHILLNIDSFIVNDNMQNPQSGYQLHCNIKQILVTFFYKYVLKKLRTLNLYFSTQLSDSRGQQQQVKYLGLKYWNQFKKSSQFTSLSKLIKQRLQFYQAQFLQSYIKKSILTIRFINKKFPQLGQNNVPLGSKFYKNFLQFIRPQIQSLNNYIIQNLQRVKVVNKTMKKDLILAFSFWIRLYIQFLQKQKCLQQIQKSNQKQLSSENKKLIQSQNEMKIKKNEQNKGLSKQLEKLSQIKKTINIQFLYNFKETTLQFKQFLSIRKKLNQIFQI